MRHRAGTTVIIGGAGKTGRRVAARLQARGASTRLASRATAPRFDWHDPTTWDEALRGAHALYITYPPDLAVPTAPEHIAALSRQAVAHGVQKIVLLSGRGEPQCYPSERAVRESGAAFTIIRCAWFAQNFSEGALHPSVLEGVVAFPAGSVAEPFVDLEDVAEVVVTALLDPKHEGQIYELSGPSLLTFDEAVTAIGRALGRDIRYLPISPDQYAHILSQFIPEQEAQFMKELFGFILDGHNAYLSDGVQRVLGRQPKDFAAFVREAAAMGAWNFHQPSTSTQKS